MEKKPIRHIFVCRRHRDPALGKPSCEANGAGPIYEAFKQELETRHLEETTQLTGTQCLHRCEKGPSAVVYPEGVWYGHLTLGDVPRIVEEHLVRGKPVEEKILHFTVV